MRAGLTIRVFCDRGRLAPWSWDAGGVTARSGLGRVELAVLSAYVELGALETSGGEEPGVVLAAAAVSGVAPRYVWDILRDLARPTGWRCR